MNIFRKHNSTSIDQHSVLLDEMKYTVCQQNWEKIVNIYGIPVFFIYKPIKVVVLLFTAAILFKIS